MTGAAWADDVSATGATAPSVDVHRSPSDAAVTSIQRGTPAGDDVLHLPVVIVGAGACGLTAALMLNDEQGVPNQNVQEILSGRGSLPLANP